MIESHQMPAAKKPPVALVTGASAGLGVAFAKLVSADGYRVVLTARREAELNRLAAELDDAVAIPADLSETGGAEAVLSTLAAQHLDVDLLINNAGFGLRGRFETMDEAAVDGMVAVNIAALTRLTRALLPPMVARRSGGVLNVASTAAFQPGPLMAVYYATKAYVLSFSEALSAEVKRTGVTVTALCPGPTRTEFQSRAGMERVALFNTPGIHVADAESVAAAGYAGWKRGRRVVIPGMTNRLTAALAPLLPRRLVLPMVKRLQTPVR